MAYLFEAEIHVARARLLIELGFHKEAGAELERAEELCADVAGHYGHSGFVLPATVRPSPEIAGIWEHHYAAGASWAEEEARDYEQLVAQQAEKREPAMVYCPSGHNAVFSQQGYDECAACGAVMTADAEESYFDSLCAAGQCM